MKPSIGITLLAGVLLFGANPKLFSHDEPGPTGSHHSVPGANIWNQAQEPTNWWNEIKQAHGHVGPWNVLGWRIGKAALRELNAKWGEHELEIVCHIPLAMPYSCTADGLIAGTGNSLGRLDLRLAEEMAASEIHISVRRKDGSGSVLIFKPGSAYLEKIAHAPDAQLESLARQCGSLPERELFRIEKMPSPETLSNQNAASR